MFRSTSGSQLAPDSADKVKSQLPELALYAPLCAYGVAQSEHNDLQRLESIVAGLSSLLLRRLDRSSGKSPGIRAHAAMGNYSRLAVGSRWFSQATSLPNACSVGGALSGKAE